MSNITIPNTLSDGNTILASEHNQNYTAITDVVNGNIDNNNIAAGAAIAASKLAIANILTTASTISIGVGTTGDINPRIALDTDGHLVLGSGSAAGDVRLTRESAGVAAIRNAADSAYEDLKVDALTAAGTVSCATISPTNALVETKGGTGQTSWATGDIPYATASNTLGKLGIGSEGYVMTVASGVPSWAAPSSTRYTSSAQTITSAGSLTLAHGLGDIPYKVWAMLTCTSGEGGYSTGDKVIIYPWANNQGMGGIGKSFDVVVDATNLNIRYGSSTNAFTLNRKDTATTFPLTNGSWTCTFFAEL